MINYDYLYTINPLPPILNIPNKDIIINIIYSNYSEYKNINEVDQYFSSNVKKNIYYNETIRPIIKILFDLGQIYNETKINIPKIN